MATARLIERCWISVLVSRAQVLPNQLAWAEMPMLRSGGAWASRELPLRGVVREYGVMGVWPCLGSSLRWKDGVVGAVDGALTSGAESPESGWQDDVHRKLSSDRTRRRCPSRPPDAYGIIELSGAAALRVPLHQEVAFGAEHLHAVVE